MLVDIKGESGSREGEETESEETSGDSGDEGGEGENVSDGREGTPDSFAEMLRAAMSAPTPPAIADVPDDKSPALPTTTGPAQAQGGRKRDRSSSLPPVEVSLEDGQPGVPATVHVADPSAGVGRDGEGRETKRPKPASVDDTASTDTSVTGHEGVSGPMRPVVEVPSLSASGSLETVEMDETPGTEPTGVDSEAGPSGIAGRTGGHKGKERQLDESPDSTAVTKASDPDGIISRDISPFIAILRWLDGWNAVSARFGGKYRNEGTLVGVAAYLEEIPDWVRRRPFLW